MTKREPKVLYFTNKYMCSNELKATFVSRVIVNVLRMKIAIPPPCPVTLGTCKTEIMK